MEIIGNGGTLLSANYERIIHFKKNDFINLVLRGGFSFGSRSYDHTTTYNLPLEINTLVGRKNHYIEIGVGCTPIFGNSNLQDTLIPVGYKSNFDYFYMLRLGYRYISKNGILFRIAPLAGFFHKPPQDPRLQLGWSLGISIGYCFNFKKS